MADLIERLRAIVAEAAASPGRAVPIPADLAAEIAGEQAASCRAEILAIRQREYMPTRDGSWKLGDEFAPFHPDASHVPPDYRDGWNACYRAAPKEAPCEASRGDLFTVQIDHLRDQRGLTYQVNIARADRSRPLPSYIPALMCVHETQRMENAAHTAAEWSLFLNGAPATPGTPGGGR